MEILAQDAVKGECEAAENERPVVRRTRVGTAHVLNFIRQHVAPTKPVLRCVRRKSLLHDLVGTRTRHILQADLRSVRALDVVLVVVIQHRLTPLILENLVLLRCLVRTKIQRVLDQQRHLLLQLLLLRPRCRENLVVHVTLAEV